MIFLQFLLTCTWMGEINRETYTECPQNEPACDVDARVMQSRDNPLPRIDPGKIGDVTNLEIVPGQNLSMITRATKPPIFEIPDFLSSAECDRLMQNAKAKGLHAGITRARDVSYIDKKAAELYRRSTVTFIPKVDDIRQRITRLTHLSADLVEDSENIQVAYYGIGGLYNTHYDSSWMTTDKQLNHLPCCHQIPFPHNSSNCLLCRYITILVYLNDVEEGGETAFPFADLPEAAVNLTGHLVDLPKHCHDASLVVEPKKGKALMWYNNFRDPENGWLGLLDKYSAHGGCPVLKGEKWIANMWLSAAQYKRRYLKSIYRKRRN